MDFLRSAVVLWPRHRGSTTNEAGSIGCAGGGCRIRPGGTAAARIPARGQVQGQAQAQTPARLRRPARGRRRHRSAAREGVLECAVRRHRARRPSPSPPTIPTAASRRPSARSRFSPLSPTRPPTVSAKVPLSAYVGAWGSNVYFGNTNPTVARDRPAHRPPARRRSTTSSPSTWATSATTISARPSNLFYDFNEFGLVVGYDFGVAQLQGAVRYSPNFFGNSGIAWYKWGQLTVPLSFIKLNENVVVQAVRHSSATSTSSASPTTASATTTTGTGRSALAPRSGALTSPSPMSTPTSMSNTCASTMNCDARAGLHHREDLLSRIRNLIGARSLQPRCSAKFRVDPPAPPRNIAPVSTRSVSEVMSGTAATARPAGQRRTAALSPGGARRRLRRHRHQPALHRQGMFQRVHRRCSRPSETTCSASCR